MLSYFLTIIEQIVHTDIILALNQRRREEEEIEDSLDDPESQILDSIIQFD